MSKSVRWVFAGAALALVGCSESVAKMTTGGGAGGNAGGGSANGGGNGGNGGGGGGGLVAETCDNHQDDDGDLKTDCADPDCFGFAQCCVDLCSDGTNICDASGVKSCELNPSTGCRVFGAAQACTNGLLCSGGACVSSCSNQCAEGMKQCASTGAVVECKKLSSGCTDWVVTTACSVGDVCSGGACVSRSSCQNQCTQATTRCTSAGLVQQCVQLSSGCTDWSFPAACSTNQVCNATSGQCETPPSCTQGDKRCNALSPAVETCDVNHAWTVTENCAQGCNNGVCTTAASCTAGTVRCNANNVEICNSTGSAWLYNQTCNVGCNGGLCTDPCTSGDKRCNGNVPETCNSAGTGWAASTTCSNGCYLGACMSADLVVDGVTTTLEGDLSYSNSVVIKNGGSLRVGPSGQLKLRAKTISIDSQSNINGNDVGDETRGSPMTSACCDGYGYSQCHQCQTGVGGSSYGSLGSGGSPSYFGVYCSYAGGTTYCTPSSAGFFGAVYDRDDDLSISKGSKYNSVKGGGLVRIVANAVEVAGQITSNSSSAGASGGGIFIAADSITGTGVLQAAGGLGSPTGGNGRVKLLRGSTNSFSGSVTGKKSESPMPPLDLVSGTHPDPVRWYNDGLGDWSIAWSKPFPTLNAYYYKVSTNPDTLPSQALGAGTYLQGESFTVAAKDLAQGANYFHIISVDSAAIVGSVKASIKTNVNTVPPTVSSSSHPTQRAWTANNALYFSWVNPQADANFTGYYYVLDKQMDTVPAAVPGNFTTNKQVLLGNTPDGIWVFHLLNRDTRGATTKAASHYVVYVGAALPTNNLSGSVYDGSNSNAPLNDVVIKVNRGLFQTTSGSSGGYTFSGNLFIGTWEVTASKTGYTPVTKTVTLTNPDAGTVGFNENFVLIKAP